MKKFCTKCGSEIEGQFCTNCGTKIETQAPLNDFSFTPPQTPISSSSNISVLPLVALILYVISTLFRIIVMFVASGTEKDKVAGFISISSFWNWTLTFICIALAALFFYLTVTKPSSRFSTLGFTGANLLLAIIALVICLIIESSSSIKTSATMDVLNSANGTAGAFNAMSVYVGFLGYLVASLIAIIFWIPSLIIGVIQAVKSK